MLLSVYRFAYVIITPNDYTTKILETFIYKQYLGLIKVNMFINVYL